MLQAGIIGLPNVGKSTLFNALTRARKAETANYPFCTIEPNVGVVQVPDGRLEPLSKVANTNVIIPAAIEFVDIAGLVAGASKGEGLGNQFLANIREVDAIAHVVRCFVEDNVIHNMGHVDPVRDIEIITTELILSDLQSIENQSQKNAKKARSGDKEAIEKLSLLERLKAHLNEMNPAGTLPVNDGEKIVLKSLFLLTAKPILYICNVAEEDLSDPTSNPHVAKTQEYLAAEAQSAPVCVISTKLEEDLGELAPEEAKEYLASLDVQDSGVSQLIQTCYNLLGLASFFTAGEKEVRAWTFELGMKAPQCAGVIHTDFEKGFIKAEVVSYKDLMEAGSYSAVRENGKYRLEGKDYPFRDGDVTLFRFNP